MIEAGNCFCYSCGNVFKESYYKSGVKTVGVILKHSKLRLPNQSWEIEPFRRDGKEITPGDRPQLLGVSGGDDGVPDSVRVRFGDGSEHELKRCCPKCKSPDGKPVETELPVDCGRYPTFVIAMVGERTVGKSTWLEAISIGKNLEAVNRVAAYPYKLDFIRKHSLYNETAATNVGGAGETNYLRIIEKATGQIVASVILLDAAGELYNSISEADNVLRKFLLGNGAYKGVDALVYFESALSHVDEIQSKEDLERTRSAFRVYSEMEKADALRDKPIAYVCTHTDQMLKQKRRIRKIRDFSGEHEVPLYSEATFRGATSYEPAVMLPRMVQEDMITRALNTDVLLGDDGKRRGFMIQSCQNRKLEDGAIFNDMNKNFNLMDPLLWILNSLRIFPIPQA